MVERNMRNHPNPMIDTETGVKAVKQVAALAKDKNIDWALVGGIAMHFYGSPPDMRWPASALAPRRAFSDRQGGAFCRQRVQTGRRLMRQTVLPTMIHGRIAPMRSESSARRFAPRGSRSARRPGLRFGLPLTPESGGPSRQPAARYALTVIRVRRRHEFQNAQQNVDRCDPPGRDPGCRGTRQSRRRI